VGLEHYELKVDKIIERFSSLNATTEQTGSMAGAYTRPLFSST